MADSDIEVIEIESPFLQRAGEQVYSYKFPTKASIVSMEDGTSVQDALSGAQETLESVSEKLDGVAENLEKTAEDLAGVEETLEGVSETLGDVTAEQLAEALADAHTHENKKDVLDLLGVDDDGGLTFDGEAVGSGSGESSTRPWTAYGDGVDEAPERLRDGGVYVSDEAEASEETAIAAVLRQKRDEDLVPIYPRTDGELVSILVDGIDSTNAAGALAELETAVTDASSAAAAAQATADQALTMAEAGGGDAGALAVEVEELKETVEAQATTIENLTEQIEALQAALDAIDLSVYMKKANDQFTGGYFGTAVEGADSGDGISIDLSQGSIFVYAIAVVESGVEIKNAVGASCFTLVLDVADAALTPEGHTDVDWPASVQWPDGEAPEIVAGVNVITFISPDAGTTWYGTVNGTSFAAEA